MRIGKLWLFIDKRFAFWLDGKGQLTKWGFSIGFIRVIKEI